MPGSYRQGGVEKAQCWVVLSWFCPQSPSSRGQPGQEHGGGCYGKVEEEDVGVSWGKDMGGHGGDVGEDISGGHWGSSQT